MERIYVNAKLRGKNLARSRAACIKRIADGKEYFLQRRGAWFRSGARGYTDDISRAGKFDAKTARSYLNSVEGMTVIPVSSMRDDLWKEMRSLLARAAALAQMATNN